MLILMDMILKQLFMSELVKELMILARHPTKYWHWCVPGDEKKEMEPIFTDKN